MTYPQGPQGPQGPRPPAPPPGPRQGPPPGYRSPATPQPGYAPQGYPQQGYAVQGGYPPQTGTPYGYPVAQAARPSVAQSSHTKIVAILVVALVVAAGAFVLISKFVTPAANNAKACNPDVRRAAPGRPARDCQPAVHRLGRLVQRRVPDDAAQHRREHDPEERQLDRTRRSRTAWA